jgi:hypothetical protein
MIAKMCANVPFQRICILRAQTILILHSKFVNCAKQLPKDPEDQDGNKKKEFYS